MMWSGGTMYNWTRLFRFLRTYNITLDSTHLSNYNVSLSTEETELLFTDVFSSRSSERTLWALDVTPELLRRMFLQPAATTLTTLELCWKLTSDHSPSYCAEDLADAPGLLHQFHCNSDLLVHLITLKTAVRLEDLDLFSRGGYIRLHRDLAEILEVRLLDDPTSPTTPPSSPSIWHCRNLRTLHIDLHAPGHHRLQHPIHSRIIFGYISRVCPLLEHLQIHIPKECQSHVTQQFYYTNLHLGLDGGLVLLGRLQSLKVWSNYSHMTSNCKEWELNWMVPSGRSSFLAKRRRRKAAEGWKDWRVKEDILEADRSPQYKQDMTNESGHGSRNSRCNNNSDGDGIYAVKMKAEILKQLQNLGLLLDVEEMLKEIETNKKFRPLPALGKLSFGLPSMKRPEDELRLLFPSAFKKWRNH
ncbi:MAG: hypothetical protein JOS17DRAFT_756307 [Linnemannia elongata]|nr:MAG: hypothetical protein JOS17DRAFT_756307 [Linnemannia elongata]